MARMRTLKPDAASSESLAQVGRQVRWTFGLLWTHCDDQGRASYNLRLIKAALYPLDDDVTLGILDDELHDLERVGAICFYEVDGKSFLHVPSWSDHQHPNRALVSKLPQCPVHEGSVSAHAHSSEPAEAPQPPLTPVLARQGIGKAREGRSVLTHRPTSEDFPEDEPPSYCAEHPHGTTKACRPCGTANGSHVKWENRRDKWLRRKLAQWDEAVKQCAGCRGDNWTEDGKRCDHPNVWIPAS